MRIWLLLIVSLLVGTTSGVVSGLWQTDLFASSPADLVSTAVDDVELPALARPGEEPRLVIDNPHYYFGRMERKATGRHTFVFKNVGQGMLSLRKGKTTCKCTLSDMKDTEVAPGESTNVTLEWTAKTGDAIFRQDATIFSNDPRRQVVKLTIEGLVVDSVLVNPPEIVFSNLTSDEEVSGKTRVFTSLRDDLKIVEHTFENAEIAKFFAVASEPLPKDALPPEMHSGCEVVVTVKPGLPQGAIQQKIRLQLNLPDLPDAEVKIAGRIGSPVSIVDPNWDQDRGVLRLGTIDRKKGISRQLKLMIRGPHRREIQFQEPRTQPDSLKATLGQPQDLGNVLAVPLSIEIPPGAPVANHLGYNAGEMGEITIASNQPEMGDVRVNVAFAVTD